MKWTEKKSKNATVHFTKKAIYTSRILSKDIVDKSVGSEFSHVVRWAVFIQRLQLGLALVELLVVTLIRVETWV